MKVTKRILLVLLAVALLASAFVVSAFAAGDTTLTWVAKDQGYANAAKLTTVEVDDVVTFTFAKNSSNTDPAYYNTGTAARLYGKNSLTISVPEGYEIKSVVLNCQSSNNVNNASYTNATGVTSGTATTITPSAAGTTSVAITNNNGNGHYRIQNIVVTYAAVAAADQNADAATKVAHELDKLVVAGNIDVAKEEKLAVTPVDYADVTISWASNSDLAVVDNAAGTVTYTLPEAGAENVVVTLTATVTCEDVTETKDFEVTLVAPPESVDGTWALVTDASSLKAGDKIVIVAAGSNFALSTTQSSNNRSQTAITKLGNNTVLFDETVQIITLENGTVEGTLAFNVGDGYLHAASSSSNYLRTQETNNANGSWKITITADGIASVVAQGSYTRNSLRYNQSSTIFSCYSSGQMDIQIYKLSTDSLSDSEKIEMVVGGISFPEKVANAGTEFALNAGTDEVSIAWSIVSGAECASIVDGKLVINTVTPTATNLVVKAVCTAGTETVEKTYTIVVKEFTEADIVDAAFALESGKSLEGTYTLSGVVSKIVTAYSTQYGNITFDIIVYGTDGVAKTLRCYRVKGEGADIIAVGDTVTLNGELTNYNGTIEFNTGSAITAYENPVTVNGAALNLNQNIDMNYYVEVLAGFKSASASVVFNGKTTTISEYVVADDGRLVFTFKGINPAEMGDKVAITVSVAYTTYTYKSEASVSVKDYCVIALEKLADNEKLVTLLSDLLVYGAAAQVYVNDTDALVTEGLSLTPSTYVAPASKENVTGDAFTSTTLALGSAVTVKYTFNAEADAVVKVTLNMKTVEYNVADLTANQDGSYTIDFTDVLATEYNDKITATIVGTENVVTFSVNSYVVANENNADANLAALVKALANYGASASAFND